MNCAHLLGVPFKYGGRDQTGVDCFGLLIMIYKMFGIDIPDHELKKGMCLVDKKIREISVDWEKIDAPEVPCAVVFWITNPDFITHIGVVIEEDKFIHAREHISVCIERLSSPAWNKRIKGFYRWTKHN